MKLMDNNTSRNGEGWKGGRLICTGIMTFLRRNIETFLLIGHFLYWFSSLHIQHYDMNCHQISKNGMIVYFKHIIKPAGFVNVPSLSGLQHPRHLDNAFPKSCAVDQATQVIILNRSRIKPNDSCVDDALVCGADEVFAGAHGEALRAGWHCECWH